jgi:hypothetical protein
VATSDGKGAESNLLAMRLLFAFFHRTTADSEPEKLMHSPQLKSSLQGDIL